MLDYSHPDIRPPGFPSGISGLEAHHPYRYSDCIDSAGYIAFADIEAQGLDIEEPAADIEPLADWERIEVAAAAAAIVAAEAHSFSVSNDLFRLGD